MQQDNLENFMTVKETAKKLNISIFTLHRWIKIGQISCYRSGRKYLFSESDILNHLNKNRINSDKNK